jgi:hypothetical protein
LKNFGISGAVFREEIESGVIQISKALAQLRSRGSLRALRVLASPGFPQLHSVARPAAALFDRRENIRHRSG